MNEIEASKDDMTDPERALVLAYVPASKRSALATLWALDMRLGRVVATTSDPAIGAIRLTWWRDALQRLDHAPPPAEPLLRRVADTVLPHVGGAPLAMLAEGWGGAFLGDEGMADFANGRGGILFGLAARILGGDPETVKAIGAGWAMADLAHGSRDPSVRAAALAAGTRALAETDGRVAVILRPLGMLGMLARIDMAADPATIRRQGSPGRIARILRYRLIGR